MPRLAMRDTSRLRRGMTLIELMITFVVLGVIGTAVTRLFTRQEQAYRDASETAMVNRQLRLGSSILPTEIRNISSAGSDIIAADEGSMTFRATIASTIVCARGAQFIDVPPANLAKHMLTSVYSMPIDGDTLFVYNENILKGSEDDRWEKFGITGVSQVAACPGAPYTDPALDAGKPRYRITVDNPIPDSVKIGAVVRITRPVNYQLLQMGGSGRWYLTFQENRGGAWTASAPIAGPFRRLLSGDLSASGLQFRYFDSTGARILPPAAAVGAPVSRIDVYMRALGGRAALKERKGVAINDSVAYRIAIRNYK
ncbi:MAG: prepilin-type N-terminal cleavage/methylation domain-containing protein [Gemmatimonadaceae bacterium]